MTDPEQTKNPLELLSEEELLAEYDRLDSELTQVMESSRQASLSEKKDVASQGHDRMFEIDDMKRAIKKEALRRHSNKS